MYPFLEQMPGVYLLMSTVFWQDELCRSQSGMFNWGESWGLLHRDFLHTPHRALGV